MSVLASFTNALSLSCGVFGGNNGLIRPFARTKATPRKVFGGGMRMAQSIAAVPAAAVAAQNGTAVLESTHAFSLSFCMINNKALGRMRTVINKNVLIRRTLNYCRVLCSEWHRCETINRFWSYSSLRYRNPAISKSVVDCSRAVEQDGLPHRHPALPSGDTPAFRVDEWAGCGGTKQR